MNNNIEMANFQTRKRNRNWNNNNTNRSPKRARLSKKVLFKNSPPDTRKLNMNNASKEARKSIKTNPITRNSPNIEHILARRTNRKTYRKKLLENLKTKGTLFKE